jgi:hypothetical protein
MLGRLKMTLAEAQNAYIEWSKTIFTPRHHRLNPVRVIDKFGATGKFESEPLTEHVKTMLHDKQMAHDELLRDQDPECCKVSV